MITSWLNLNSLVFQIAIDYSEKNVKFKLNQIDTEFVLPFVANDLFVS